MSHEIESMMYAGDVPWHGLGVKADGAITSEEAIKAAGLDWQVDKEAMFTGEGTEIETHRAARRSTDGKILGIVGKGYEVLQNRPAFAWFDPFVRAGEATYEAAGSLREGSRIWILAKINRPDSIIVPASGDAVRKYVLLATGHDGTLSAHGGYTPVRVVCANTLQAAREDRQSALFKFRHTSKIEQNLDSVREMMNIADATFEASAAQYRALAARGISGKQLEQYVETVFELKKPDSDGKKPPRRSHTMDAVTDAFTRGKGNDLPGVRGTWWAAYNAVTDYLTHTRGTDDATRLDSQWMGDGAVKNARALQYAYVQATA